MNTKNLKNLIAKKRLIWMAVAIVILFLGYQIFFNEKSTEELLTVQRGDFLQQVSASGKIIPKDSLALSFSDMGQVASVNVRVGDQVKAGQLLASQNTAELSAQYVQMQAGVDLQRAKLAQLMEGASPEDVRISESAVASAQQDLENSCNSGLASLQSAYTTFSYIEEVYLYADSSIVDQKAQMSLSITEAKRLVDAAKASNSIADLNVAAVYMVEQLSKTYNNLEFARYVTDTDRYEGIVPLAQKEALDTQKTNVAAAKSSITSKQSALVYAQSQLELKKAPARNTDVSIYQAQLKQAEGSLQAVGAQLNKKRIYSPIDGVVTVVNAKVGGIFGSQETAIAVISKGNFQIESFVPEVNISFLQVGQEAQVTLDAYGSQALFVAKVVQIDPAETIKDGVSTYKVTLEFDGNDDRVKSGMTGNVIVTTDKKSDVVSIPQGLVKIKDGKKVVLVKQGDIVVEKEVQTGAIASNGNIEITSGLEAGQTVIVKR